jgi:hypothetical protein
MYLLSTNQYILFITMLNLKTSPKPVEMIKFSIGLTEKPYFA